MPAGRQRHLLWVLALMFVVGASIFAVAGQDHRLCPQSGSSTAGTPAFGENDALDTLDNLQATLQSYDRKKFLAAFDPGHMPDFNCFRKQVEGLFGRYDSFTVTYHLVQSAMEGNQGVVLADFGLDATSESNDVPDLRRHAQLRLMLAWNGKRWKIVKFSPSAMFQ